MDSGRCFPPGFRFHPTDEELVGYYLKRKICRKRHHTDVIGETDVYKCDPEELPAMSKLRTGDRQWFFFSPRDRKYPNGARSNRATGDGYWKATGKDRIISSGSRAAGIKKTLVFYRGRAPKGQRTDWVMHEYTMDEEELKRCTGAKEYYALYKVFKKSGPGPKNGEQYGAPFREEDWDEQDLEVQPFIVGENSATKSADDTVPVNEIMPENGQYVPSMDDLRDFKNRIENESITTLPHPQFHNDSSIFEHLLARQGTETNSVEYSARDIPASVPHTHLHITETPEVSSAPILDTGLTEEEIFGDFLEMDDLLVPCPATENPSHLNGELLLDELDGLNVYDFQDASPILFDGGINDLGQLQSYSGYFGYDIGVTSTVSTSTHQMQQHSTNVSEFSYTEGQSYSVGAVESGQEIVPPSNPGSIHENQTLHHVNHRTTGSVETRINQQDDDGNASWLSSAIWSYMESIPTTPASASESAFVNQAFERISSFGRLRLNARNMNVVSGNNVLPSSGKCRSNWLMFLVSVFGVFCAVIWMFMGTRVRLLG